MTLVEIWGLGADQTGDKLIWVMAIGVPLICGIPSVENIGKLTMTEAGGSSPSTISLS